MKITCLETLSCLYSAVWIYGAVATPDIVRGCWIIIFYTFFFVCPAVKGPYIFGQMWHITECCRLFLGQRLAFLTKCCILLIFLSFSGKCWNSTFLFFLFSSSSSSSSSFSCSFFIRHYNFIVWKFWPSQLLPFIQPDLGRILSDYFHSS